MSAPLAGIKVLDLSLGLQGPYCAMMLADMGAEVIKVERPDVGEGMRYMYLSHVAAGLGASWAGVNRGKRSLALDIRPESGREAFLKLVGESDVLIQNFRPGVMARLGYDYESLAKVNPRLIMASLSAYGPEGPHAHRVGQDLLAQAYSGMIALQGYADGEPQSVGAPIADATGAITAAWGIALALYAREVQGVGQEITTNLADALLALAPMDWADYLHTGQLRKGGRGWYANMPYGPWRARDKDVVINLQGEIGWPEFCIVLGMTEIQGDSRFATNADRVANRIELEEIVRPIFRERDAAEWAAMFAEFGLRCDPVYNYRDLELDPQTAINEMIIEQHHPDYGRIRTVGQAVKLGKTQGVASRTDHLAPPVFAEHTAEILHRLGFSDERIATMENEGVVNTRKLPPGIDIDDALQEVRGRRRLMESQR